MANIRQRGNSFQISVYVGEDQNGNKLFERTTFTPTETAPSKARKEAESYAREFEDRVKNGRYFQGDKMTFLDVIERWKEDSAYKNLTLSIREDYEDILNNRVVSHIGKLIIGKISPMHLQQLYNEMESEGYAPSTIRRTNGVINSVMSFAYRMELIKSNPCDRVKLPKIDADTDLHFFDVEQSKYFLQSLSGEFNVIHKGHKRTLKATGEEYSVPDYNYTVSIPYLWQVYFTIAVYSGFRRGEMIALTWEDINFNTQSISINKAITRTKAKGQIIKATKTVAGVREIKLPSICFTMLKEWKKQERELSLSVGTKWEGYRGNEFDKNFIFIQTEKNIGQHMDVDSPTGKFKEIVKLINENTPDPEKKLPIIRLHDLRHTSATLLIAQGVDIETISHRLGHSKASVTMDVYGHFMESMDETASDTLEKLLSIAK